MAAKGSYVVMFLYHNACFMPVTHDAIQYIGRGRGEMLTNIRCSREKYNRAREWLDGFLR